MNRDWFEMKSIRKQRLENSVWVPLRQSALNKEKDKQYGHEGYREEFCGVGSVLVPLSLREQGENLGWSEIGLMREQGPVVSGDIYQPTGFYQIGDGEDFGVEPVLVQNFLSDDLSIWHLNQDIVFALRLLPEGDKWLRPDEMSAEVIRVKRNDEGKPVLLEMKTEFLKDYLAARNMALRVSRYFQRVEIFENIVHLGGGQGVYEENDDKNRFQIHVMKIHEGGHPFGEEAAVFHWTRNDVDPDEDVPVMGPENDSNVEQTSWTKKFDGRALYRVAGEFWVDEWIEPAACSPRVRCDDLPSSCEFIINASGEKLNADALKVVFNDKDVGRWLWFRNEIIEAVSECPGSSLSWHTRDTGNITPCPGYSVHFGLNELQLITVYGPDIARLPEWQKRFWVGYNVSPEGGVSKELLDSQVKANPAPTQAPEPYFATSLERLNAAAEHRWGDKLLREHSDVDKIMPKIHRFRARDRAGLFSLAKDIFRLTGDRLNIAMLHRVAPPPESGKRGSLKSLEHALATIATAGDARSALTPLIGVYELRLCDAHLASSRTNKALNMSAVDPNAHPIQQGFQLIQGIVLALQRIAKTLSADGRPTNADA